MHVDHLRAACAAEDTPVAGIEMGRELSHVLHENRDELDGGLAEADVIDACYDLHDRHPNVGAIVLECTNLVPYARAASEAVGLPVFDIYTFLCWFQAGLSPRGFGHPG